MRINRYLSRLHDTIRSRTEIQVEFIRAERLPGNQGFVVADLCFYDGSLLAVSERVRLERNRVVKAEYRYHYQRADGTLVFRYDNAPHHPEVSTHPHHVHVGERVEPAEPPDLSDVLREIDGLLYPTKEAEQR